MSDIGKALGGSAAFRLGDHVADVYPVRLKDWPEFTPVLFALEMENLHEIHFFNDGPLALMKLVTITLRVETMPDFFSDMVQAEYSRFRALVIQQNELDFEKLKKKISGFKGESDSKKDETLP